MEQITSKIDYIRETLPEGDRWGQLAEEASELAQAALKMQRICFCRNLPSIEYDEAFEHVVEEVSDVQICLNVLPEIDAEVRRVKQFEKLFRWCSRLEQQEYGVKGGKYDEERR